MHTLAQSISKPLYTRAGIVTHTSLSLRYVDTLTKNGTLPHYRIGKSVRYDLAEVEAALRERFHIRSKARSAKSSSAVSE
jgi:excisionase family DNA binding protein